MTFSEPDMSVEFQEFAALQLRRHELLVEAKQLDADTDDTDDLEDQMTALWDKLDETQRQSLKGMSSDLNWIRRNGEPAPKSRLPSDVTAEDHRLLLKSINEKRWHEQLHYLRLCASAIPPYSLAYRRGRAYEAIGLFGYSSAFYDQAIKFEPGNSSMWFISLRAAQHHDPERALLRAEEVLKSPLDFPPIAVAMSVAIRLQHLEKYDHKIDTVHFSEILKRTLDRLNFEPSIEPERAMVIQLAASAFEILNEIPLATWCYEEALKLSPQNEVLNVAFGLLFYGRDTKKAVPAFLNAIHKQTDLVWPYFYLGHHYIRSRKYSNSLKMIQLALARASTNAVRAELLQWQAICYHELGHYPAELVHSLLESASTLAPHNKSIQTNFAVFQNSDTQATWSIEEERALVNESSPTMELPLVGVS